MSTLSLPVGFVEQRRDNTLWWLKAGWESLLPDLVLQDLAEQSPRSSLITHHSSLVIPGGRGPIQRIQITPHEAIIVRPYRRGGLVRHFIRDMYWDQPPRPFVELCCTEEAQQRGIPTVEVLGACVEWTMGVLYRGWLVTREATGFLTLWEWLQTEEATDLRRQTFKAVAHAVAAMHKGGIAHADLNPTNILVDPTGDPPQVLLIDFDRARMFSQRVPAALREANLRRFRRFFKKHDVLEEWMTTAEFAYFDQMYHAAFL
jgi:3-deoxy-D-manno-octulosonic acid kinase